MRNILPGKGSKGYIDGDNASCAVTATANAFDISLEEAQARCRKYGRAKNAGMWGHAFARMVEAHGATPLAVYGCTDNALAFKQSHRYIDHLKGCTLRTFMQRHPVGTFILFLTGHFTVVRDGQLIDDYALDNRSIAIAWSVEV